MASSRCNPLQLLLLLMPILLLLAPPAAAQPPSQFVPLTRVFNSRTACLAAYEECLSIYPGCVSAVGDNGPARLACDAYSQDVCEEQIHASCDKPPTSSVSATPVDIATKPTATLGTLAKETKFITIQVPPAPTSTLTLNVVSEEAGSLVVVELKLTLLTTPRQSAGVRVVSRGWMWAAVVAVVITTSHSSVCACAMI